MKIICLQEEMTSKATYTEACLFPIMNGQILRQVVSDVSSEIDKLGKDLSIAKMNDDGNIVKAECYCCGLQEECTQEYIGRVKDSHSGKWVCGLCSEAVKERSKRTTPSTGGAAIEEALSTHRSFCVEFNSTTRLNPKLSFTCTMREIAKRSNLSRKMNNQSYSKITRTSSCIPKLS